MVAGDDCCCPEGVGSGSSLLGYTSTEPQLVQCSSCSGTGFNAPFWWDIAISGVVNDACSQCDSYNSTFRVEYNSGFSIGRCVWTLDIPETCAICRPIFPDVNPVGVNIVFLEMFGFQSPTPATMEVNICTLSKTASGNDALCDPSFSKIRWREVFNISRPDCLNFDNRLLNDSFPAQSRCPNNSPPPFGLVDPCEANAAGAISEVRLTAVTMP